MPLNVRHMTEAEKAKLSRKGANYLVIVHYPYDASETKGDVVSWHKTLRAAEKAATYGFHAVLDLFDVLVEII